MRKFLLLGVLFAAISASAQVVSDMKVQPKEVMSALRNSKRMDIRPVANKLKAEKKLTKESLKAAMNRVGESDGLYLVDYVGGMADFMDIPIMGNIEIGETTATLHINIYDTDIAFTGTVSGNGSVITIPPTVALADAFDDGSDLYFGALDTSGSSLRTTDIVLQSDEYGNFTSTTNVAYYAATSSTTFDGYVDWFNGLTMTPMTQLIPYASSDDYWYYGIDNATANFASLSLMGVVSANAGTVDWYSYVSYLADYPYSVEWQYGQSTSTEAELQIPVNSEDLTFPVVTASLDGTSAASYYFGDGATMTAGGSSTINGVDYGFTTWCAWQGMVLPMAIDYAYGTKEVPLDTNGDNYSDTYEPVTHVLCYYPNKGGQLVFNSIDMLLLAPEALEGNLSVTIIESGLQNGFPMVGDTIAYCNNIALNNMDVWNEIDMGGGEYSSYGTLSFSNFYTLDEDGWEVELPSISIDTPFIVAISDFSQTEAGLFMDASSDLNKTILSDTENVYLLAGDYILRETYYRNPAVMFRGATISVDPSSIDAVASEDGNIKVGFDGGAWSLSYAEGIRGVQVVNVAGQVVADYALDGTSATIPASALAKGLYILKFDNGQSVKVMK